MGKRDCEIVKPMPRGYEYLLAKDVLIMFLREGGMVVIFWTAFVVMVKPAAILL